MKRMIRCVVALGLVFVLCSCNRVVDNNVFQENFLSHKDLFDTFREYVNKELYKNDDITLESISVYFSPDGDSYEASCYFGKGTDSLECSLSQAQEQAVSMVPELFADITKKYHQFDQISLSLRYDGGILTLAEMYIYDYAAHYYKSYILEVEQGSLNTEEKRFCVILLDNWYLYEFGFPD